MEVSNCILIKDSLYLAMADRMIVLDAYSGKRILDEPSGINEPYLGDTLWSDGERLFMIRSTEPKIRVFSKDGKTVLQEISCEMAVQRSVYPMSMFRPWIGKVLKPGDEAKDHHKNQENKSDPRRERERMIPGFHFQNAKLFFRILNRLLRCL